MKKVARNFILLAAITFGSVSCSDDFTEVADQIDRPNLDPETGNDDDVPTIPPPE